MKIIENKVFDSERALYGLKNAFVSKCIFDGEADGESAIKECSDIQVENSFFNLRYPFWHNNNLKIFSSEMTINCRAALWYSNNILLKDTKLAGIKALRECSYVNMERCNVFSSEFGWYVDNVKMEECSIQSEYFMMRSSNLDFNSVTLDGKYSFQYIRNSVFENCYFNTKDAFWHAENVIIRNSTIKGEYLGWYCKNVTFENCKITGTQPLCYCKNLRLIDCEMSETDLCFEKSEVNAVITTPVISIKNVISGRIVLPSVNEIIDDDNSKCEIVVKKK